MLDPQPRSDEKISWADNFVSISRHWKLFGFYRTAEGFWPDFADFTHDYTQEFYRSYSVCYQQMSEDQ